MKQPWNVPVNVLDGNSNQQIKELGELARSMVAFDLICLEHGIFAREIQESQLDLKEKQHRIGEGCWHEITSQQSKK